MNAVAPPCFIGLMSGTSMDSIDAVAMDFGGSRPVLVATHRQPLPSDLRQRLLLLCQHPAQPALGALDSELGEQFAAAATALLAASGLPRERIKAIGSHGQTIYHRPPSSGRNGYTQQIADPNLIALRTGITTVADFRRKDMAAGGQGAPLVPAFHRAVFHSAQENRVILNIGGIANITILPAAGTVNGFDTGPGNLLLDAWIARHLGKPYDENGDWARGGTCDHRLLDHLLADPYFTQAPPKSTGRELFNLAWLDTHLAAHPVHGSAQDVQATLTHLSARSIAMHLHAHAPATQAVYVCGGGAYNSFLMELLREACRVPVRTTDDLGIAPEHVEAAAFAWLAKQTLEGKPGNLTSVTGARQEVVLGGIYPP